MIRFRVIAVLFLKDSLTGAPVPASAVRIIAGGLKRLNKGDGIICLVEEGGRNIAQAGKEGAPIPAELRSAIYLTERFSLPADSQTPLMLPLFLLPSMGYPGKQGMTRVFGRAPEGSEVVMRPEEPSRIRIREPYTAGSTMRLYQEQSAFLEGRFFRLRQKGKEYSCRLGEAVVRNRDYTEYELLVHPEADEIRPEGLLFYPEFRTRPDESGSYQLFLPWAPGKAPALSVRIQKDGAEQERTFSAEAEELCFDWEES